MSAARRAALRIARSTDTVAAVLRRQSAGSFNEFGEFVPGTIVDVDVDLVTAPITGEDRQTLPEGIRLRNVRSFWLRESVTAAVEGDTGQTGDRIVLDGVTYQIFELADWDGFVECQGSRRETVAVVEA